MVYRMNGFPLSALRQLSVWILCDGVIASAKTTSPPRGLRLPHEAPVTFIGVDPHCQAPSFEYSLVRRDLVIQHPMRSLAISDSLALLRALRRH